VSSVAPTTARVGFGTGGLLRIGSARGRQNALAAALASGITHFDTAPLYGFGESERALGRFLRGRRAGVTLTTKFGLQASALAARLAFLQGIGRRALELFPALRRTAVRNAGVLATPPSFSLPAVQASLEKSLRALRTDYVDFFLAHQASAAALPDADLIGWLQDTQRAGKIRAFGVSTEFDWLLPVLEQRPQLSRVVQFDSELIRGNIGALGSDPDRLLITYGFIARSVAACRERLARENHPTLQRASDDELGGLLLRAAVLANPGGIVLTQSRSTARIERNARAATTDANDAEVRALVSLLRTGP
jgi:aryl-alcohol dehydrogenase-like predicted oxidoreductase